MVHNSCVNCVVSERNAKYYSKNAFVKIITFVASHTCVQMQLNMCYAIIQCLEVIPEEISRLDGSFLT